MSTLHLAAGMLIASNESKKSGPIGLAVILLLCIGCYFLFKSMSRHLRKVRDEFPQPDDAVGAVIQPAAQVGDPDAVEGAGGPDSKSASTADKDEPRDVDEAPRAAGEAELDHPAERPGT